MPHYEARAPSIELQQLEGHLIEHLKPYPSLRATTLQDVLDSLRTFTQTLASTQLARPRVRRLTIPSKTKLEGAW